MKLSVVKSQRKLSKLEYVYNARELEIFSLQQCLKFPKRYTFYLGQQISNLAISIHKNIHMSNCFIPINDHEKQIQRDFILKALLLCKHLAAQISVAEQMFGVNKQKIQTWSELINKEISLLEKILNEN